MALHQGVVQAYCAARAGLSSVARSTAPSLLRCPAKPWTFACLTVADPALAATWRRLAQASGLGPVALR